MENEKIEICAVAAIHGLILWYFKHDKSTSNSERLVIIIVRNINFLINQYGTEFIIVFIEKLKNYNCDLLIDVCIWCY